MAKFFVGQRVRVRYTRNQGSPEWHAGAEGRIVEIGPWARGDYHSGFNRPFLNTSDCLVDVSGEIAAPLFDQLEPILPDGHRAGDYSLSDLLDRCRAGEGVVA